MTRSILVSSLICSLFSTAALATSNPFTEDFNDNSANWFNATLTGPLGWSGSGGPDGGAFAFGAFNFENSLLNDTPALLRAQDEFGSSGGAFVGDWIDDGVTLFSAQVRHDAPVPLNFFTRFSGPFNFPGAVAVEFAPVAPNTWTEISFAIDALNPQFVTFEGSDFDTVFGNIGHVQIGVTVPSSLAGVDADFTFSVDKASIVPAPAALLPLVIGLVACSRRGRRSS